MFSLKKQYILEKINKNWILFLIIILGAFLRLFGINYDLPLSSPVGDEIRLLSGSLKMLNEKSFIVNSAYGSYFPLLYYLYIPGLLVYALLSLFFSDLNSLESIKDSVFLSLGSWLIVGRLISVILGVLSIYLFYLITQKLFNNKNVSLIAALFFSLNPLNVALSHFGRIWAPQMFFILLALYFCLRFFVDSNNKITHKKLLIAVIFIILSIAANLFGFFSYFIFLLILFIFYFEFNFKKFFIFLISKKSLFFHTLLLMGIFLIFFLSRSSLLLYGSGFRIMISPASGEIASWVGTVWDTNIIHRIGLSLSFLWQLETIIFLLFVPSFWLIYKYNKKNFYFLLLLFLTFFLLIGPPLLHSTRSRYMSLAFPFLSIPVAYFVNVYFKKISKKNIFLGLIFILILIFPTLFINLKYDYLLSKNSTRLTLYNWIKENVKPNENILLINDYFLQDIIPNEEVIRLIKENSPQYYSTRLYYLENDLFKKLDLHKYGIYSSGFICEWPRESFENIKFDYLVVSETNNDFNPLNICDDITVNYFSNKELVFEENTAPFYNYSIENGMPLNSYRPIYLINKLGPKISIYKIK
jgi:hypothetical protein